MHSFPLFGDSEIERFSVFLTSERHCWQAIKSNGKSAYKTLFHPRRKKKSLAMVGTWFDNLVPTLLTFLTFLTGSGINLQKGDSIMGNHPHLSRHLLSQPICSPAYLTLNYLAQPLSSFLFIYHYCQFCFVCPQKCHPFSLKWDCDSLGSSGNAQLKWHLASVWVISVSLAIRWVSRLFC